MEYDLNTIHRPVEDLQARFFANRDLVIAANRGPVSLDLDNEGNLQIHRGGGGLVTALTGICRYTRATWIACALTEADARWRSGWVPLEGDAASILAQMEAGTGPGKEPDVGPGINVQFLSPEPEAYDGYYNVISNPLLWFLQHSMWDVPRAPIIDSTTWQAWQDGYVAVNRQFADAVCEQVQASNRPSLVMLQDYHLYLTPRFMCKQIRRLYRPTLLHFIHIPWPGPEYWRILPPAMRQSILDGLCAVDVLGFQTVDDSLNFIRTCESMLPKCYVNYKHGRIWYRNHATYVRDFPISIDVQAIREMAQSTEVAEHALEFEHILADRQMILRIDRIEPSKNIIRGFLAFEQLLENYPEHRENVTFVAILVPSRLGVDEYQHYLNELMAAAGQVNARFGSSEWEPIRLLVGEDYPRAVAAMRRYDALLINAIADGMNLVAKEGPIVNQRHGVLILSERAGARQQLGPGATVISPCDVHATAQALHQALTMPLLERQERAARLRWVIEREDINDWLYRQLEAVVSLNLSLPRRERA